MGDDDEKTPSMMDQIAQLAPTELLSEDGAATMFTSFEADRDIAWDRSNLPFELMDHPRRALKWAMVAAAAERYVADLQIAVKNLRANLDAKARQLYTESGVKYTEAMITSTIDSDREWQEAQRTLHEAEAKAQVCGDMRDLFRHRKDLLVQEALQMRMEGAGGDPVISLEARKRQSATRQLEDEAATLAAAAGAGGAAARRPSRTPIK